ncbi:heterokaryon incompatibility protein-domain-containing protein [Xylariaceae sp. FL1019]|nr:heterokaryon incompatibility protein-domain-containing protein [Xylariaceae sp. FL1019]
MPGTSRTTWRRFKSDVYRQALDSTTTEWDRRKYVCELSDPNLDSTSFSYKRLKLGEVRFLILHPGGPEDELKCSMATAKQAQDPPTKEEEMSFLVDYQAVSYAWESPASSYTIKCNIASTVMSTGPNGEQVPVQRYGDVFESVLHISSSLYTMLKTLRCLEHYKTYWIDAICINQADKVELAEQVKKMRSIYSKASNVIVWLGYMNTNSLKPPYAFQAAKRLAAMMKSVDVGGPLPERFGIDLFGFSPWKRSQNDHLYLDRTQWQILQSELLIKPWFERTWIRQEIALAARATVIWGSHQIDWETLSEACRAVSELNVNNRHSANHMIVEDLATYRKICRARLGSLPVNQITRTHITTLSLESLLSANRNSKATDPRDKVFGLMGMALMHGRSPINVSYTLPIRHIYTEVAQYLLNERKPNALDFLSHVQSDYDAFDLPSWVPNWTTRLLATQIVNVYAFHAATSRTMDAEVLWNHDCDDRIARLSWHKSLPRHCLRSSGARIFSVREVVSFENYTAHARILKYLPRQYPMTGFTGYLDLYERLFDTSQAEDFCLGHLRDQKQNFWAQNDHIHDHDELLTTYSHGELLARTQHQKFPSGRQFHGQSISIQKGRQIFVTTNGFMGIVPLKTRPGDDIVLLFGASVPFVVRKAFGDHYWLVGECVVIGVMEGEAMEGLPEDRIQDFFLC